MDGWILSHSVKGSFALTCTTHLTLTMYCIFLCVTYHPPNQIMCSCTLQVPCTKLALNKYMIMKQQYSAFFFQIVTVIIFQNDILFRKETFQKAVCFKKIRVLNFNLKRIKKYFKGVCVCVCIMQIHCTKSMSFSENICFMTFIAFYILKTFLE